jgi:hypothetical protein
MAHQKEGYIRMGLFNCPVDPAYIVLYCLNAVDIIAVTQKPALPRLVYRKISRLPVTPLIRGPNLNALTAKPPGKFIIPERMFRHAVHNVQNSFDPLPPFPTPQKKFGPAACLKPPFGGLRLFFAGFDLPLSFRYT